MPAIFRDTTITDAVLDGWAVTGIGELSQNELDGGVKILNAVRDKAKLSPNLATFTPDHLQALYVKGSLAPPRPAIRIPAPHASWGGVVVWGGGIVAAHRAPLAEGWHTGWPENCPKPGLN